MSIAAEFRTAYRFALAGYLADQAESGLRAAYELGRDAVEHRLSVLDLAAVHHESLIAAFRGCSDSREIEATTRAAADFFLESLSAFEMVQRGYTEAREAAILERRHAAILRQLSNLLADASLALGASESLDEILQLVAEQARELTNARYCRATVAFPAKGDVIEAVSHAGSAETAWPKRAESDSVSKAYSRLRSARGSVGAGRDIRDRPRLRELARENARQALPTSLSAPLTTLDGREFGFIELIDKSDGDFTKVDEAVLMHLAQMAAAALERSRLYQQ